MKHSAILIMVFVFLSANLTSVSGQDKKTREEKRQEKFEETVQLIEDLNFIFEADRAFPQGGASIDLTTNYGFLKIKKDSTAVGDLPFFGRAFSVDYGGSGGIEFSGKMEELEYSANKERKRISFSFKVKDDDYYQISFDVSYNGDASLNVISQNRSSIRYNGDISLPEEEKQ